MLSLSVIVTTYNRPDALEAVLRAYAAQTYPAFEMLVADDGSTTETQIRVERFARSVAFPVQHVWQEDQGFRAAAIRNKALAKARGDYVIFTDGDCIPRNNFLAQHARLAEPGWFLSGNRVLLSEKFTRQVLAQQWNLPDWSYWRLWAAWVQRKINRFSPFITLPDAAFRQRHAHEWRGAKTCNLSAWRSDLISVNGLDEAFTGWGFEDSDLVIRLLRAGVKHKSARFATPVFHLWHQENDRSRMEHNEQQLQQVLNSTHIKAARGLDQYPTAA
jgi:glycosyltransferase involved in cell wall biosynthesis